VRGFWDGAPAPGVPAAGAFGPAGAVGGVALGLSRASAVTGSATPPARTQATAIDAADRRTTKDSGYAATRAAASARVSNTSTTASAPTTSKMTRA
jgi:hypothetical protein